MKGYTTFFIIAVMIGGLGFLLFTRDRAKHDAPAEIVVVEADGGADAGSAADGGAAVAAADAAAPKALAEVPLRVTTLGWELAAAGAAMTPPDGGAPRASVPAIELAPEPGIEAIEARLARGGADAQGADIAILSLPAFVQAFDKLRALEPRAFLVVGFSHGREEMHASVGALAKAPPGGDEVKLIASPTAEATVLGLFALDLLGVTSARVRVVAPDATDLKGVSFAAVVKGTPDERKVAFSTVEASRLVPIVAVAPRSLLESREAAVREWSKAWLDGLAKARADAPGTARRLAAKEGLPMAAGVGGAPEALVLVERLGQIEGATLEGEGAWIGAAAKTSVTLETLAQRTWQLARGGGVTTSSAPDPLPIDARIVTAIAPAPHAAAPEEATADGGVVFGPIPSGSTSLLVHRATEGDAERVASQIAFLSGVFERASFKVTAKGGEKAARAIASSAHDKGVPAKRLGISAAEPGIFATVEILAAP